MTEEKNQQMANVLRDIANSTITRFQNTWPDEDEMLSMGYKDASDYTKIGYLITKSRYKEAAKVAWNMDTAARDNIPDDIYEFLGEAV